MPNTYQWIDANGDDIADEDAATFAYTASLSNPAPRVRVTNSTTLQSRVFNSPSISVAEDPDPVVDPVSSFIIGAQTFTLGSVRQIVRHADCDGNAVVCIVVPSGTETVTVSPGTDDLAGRTVNGGMKNPVYSESQQGFDSDGGHWAAGVSVDTTSPVSLTAGDILVSALSKTDYLADNRNGTVDEYAAVYVATTVPDATSLAPPVIGWTGRSSVAATAAINWTALATSLPSYAVSTALPRTATQLLNDLRFNPGPAINWRPTAGYDNRSPFRWSFGDQLASANYGGHWTTFGISTAATVLLSDDLTTEQKVQLLKTLASFGRQCYETWDGSSQTIVPDGGHYQFHMLPIAIYLWVTGQTAKLSTMFADGFAGNFEQAIELTSGQVALLAPSSLATTPYIWRLRDVVSVSGTTITLPSSRALGDPAQGSLVGGEIVRQSDGATANILSISNTFWNNANFSVVINTQPGIPFAPSDSVYVRPRWTTPTAGWVDWSISGDNEFSWYSPLGSAVYRNGVMRWSATIAFLQATGLLSAEMEIARAYIIECNKANFPASVDDWDDGHGLPYCRTFWNENWATIYP